MVKKQAWVFSRQKETKFIVLGGLPLGLLGFVMPLLTPWVVDLLFHYYAINMMIGEAMLDLLWSVCVGFLFVYVIRQLFDPKYNYTVFRVVGGGLLYLVCYLVGDYMLTALNVPIWLQTFVYSPLPFHYWNLSILIIPLTGVLYAFYKYTK